MEQMTEAEWREFVSIGTRTGKIGVALADGAPHVTPIWFVLDGPDLVFTTHSESLKGKALLRDPRAAICVDDEQPPYTFVTIKGETTVSEDPAELSSGPRSSAAVTWARIAPRSSAPATGCRANCSYGSG